MSRHDDDENGIEIDEGSITVDADKLERGRLGLTCTPGATLNVVPHMLIFQVPRCLKCGAYVHAAVLERTISTFQPIYVCPKCNRIAKLTMEDSFDQWTFVAELRRMQAAGKVHELSMVEKEDEECLRLMAEACRRRPDDE